MWPNPQKTADLVTFTEEILNGKLHFCAVLISDMITDMYKNNFLRDFEKRNLVIQNPMVIEQCTFAKLKVW